RGIPFRDEIGGPAVLHVRCGLHGGRDDDVRVLELDFSVVVEDEVERELEVGEDRVVIDLLELPADVDGDDDVGAQPAGGRGRYRLHDAAVDIHPPVDLHGRKHPGNRHAGDDGPAQRAVAQGNRFARDDVGD